MEIKESRDSRISQFKDLVSKHCPHLKAAVYDNGLRFDYYRKRWFVDVEHERILNVYRPSDKKIFQNGEWEDITIDVLDKEYFDCAKKIAEDYEKITQRKVTVIKGF